MIRISLGLIIIFALIAAACVAFGAYFSFATLENAHKKAVEARFAITAERIAGIAQVASSLGISLPSQTTLTDLLHREARLDETILSIDVTNSHSRVLFSSDPERIGGQERQPASSVSRRIENDLAATEGMVVVRYDPAALAAGATALSEALGVIAMPTLAGAALATLAIGLLLASGLGRAAKRAADPAHWPPAARAALAEAEAAHSALKLEDRT